MAVEIKEVLNNSDLKKFINFYYTLYKDNKYCCPPLRMDEYNTLHWKKNPAFEFCEARYWLAYKNGKIVGRIAGMINHKANETWNEKHVRFGWIDFIDDEEVSTALVQTVEDWAKYLGYKALHGPLGFTDMDKEGMLVMGFDELGTLASIYNYEYYNAHLEKLGYSKDVDWLQFEFEVPAEKPEKVAKIAEIVKRRYNVKVLQAKKAKDFVPYAQQIFDCINESFKPLYGYTALSQRQKDAYTKQYLSFVEPDYVTIILDSNDKVIGVAINLPSLTRALQKTQGKLFPFGFIHMLRALKKPEIIDMYLIGLLPEWQGKGINAIFFDEQLNAFIKHKIKYAVNNQQLETNHKGLSQWEGYNGRNHLRRRCYIKHFEY